MREGVTDIEALRARLLARHGSVHAFCRQHPELCRSTVYLVLSGRYPGNGPRQAGRIAEALGLADEDRTARISEALIGVACSHCRSRNKNKRRKCRLCRALCRAQAATLLSMV